MDASGQTSARQLREMARELNSTARALDRLHLIRIDDELMDDVGDILVAGTRDRMLRGETADGKRHKKLSKPHLEWKDAQGYDSRIWIASGAAYREVAANVVGRKAIEVTIGGAGGNSGVIHDGGHSEADGASGGPYLVPARPVLGVSDDDEKKIRDALGRWLDRSLSQRGLRAFGARVISRVFGKRGRR